MLDALNGDFTTDAVVELVQNICTIFPDELEPECDNFIDKYYNELLQYFDEHYSTDIACTAMGACE